MDSEEKKIDTAVAGITGEQIASMTKEEALEFLGLPADADKEALENRFWQLSKKYRSLKGDESEQKLADLSAAYDIASGNRDLRVQAEETRAHEKKFMGKTKDVEKGNEAEVAAAVLEVATEQEEFQSAMTEFEETAKATEAGKQVLADEEWGNKQLQKLGLDKLFETIQAAQ